MNRSKIEALIEQYRNDPSVIFAMPGFMQETPCGTAFCIAGQVATNAGWKLVNDGRYLMAYKNGELTEGPWFVAATELQLSDLEDLGEVTEAERLFLKCHWPSQFRDLPDTSALAADRLQHFLDTDGAE